MKRHSSSASIQNKVAQEYENFSKVLSLLAKERDHALEKYRAFLEKRRKKLDSQVDK